MKKIVITGYNDRNDGPSVFINTLTNEFKKKHYVHNAKSSFGLKDLYELIKSDVVMLNSNNTMPLLICFVLVFLPKKKVLGIIHGGAKIAKTLFEHDVMSKMNLFFITSFSDFIVFVSNKQKDKFCKVVNKNMHSKFLVIPNGIDVDKLIKYQSAFKSKQIIYAGGESEEKGRLFLDKVISYMSTNEIFKDYKLIAIGMNYEISFKVGYLDVEHKHKMSHDDFLKLLSESEIFLSLSPEETFGIACAEAVFLKLKVVCSEQCGFIECTRTLNVFTAANHHPDFYYDALCLCLNSSSVDYFNLQSCFDVDNMISMYSNLIQPKNLDEVEFDSDKRHK